MTQKLLLVVLLSGTLCAGQSVLTTPTESTRSVPGSAAAPTSGGESAPMRAPQQMGERTDSGGSSLVAGPGADSAAVPDCRAVNHEI